MNAGEQGRLGGLPDRNSSPAPFVIFAAGGPLTADVEETIARLGVHLSALVRNRPGPCRVLTPELLVDAEQLSDWHRSGRFLCALFTPTNRRVAVAEAKALGLRPAGALIDPTSVVAASTHLGPGSYVNAGCVMGAAGTFGNFVIVNRAASLGHHASVGDFASIGPGVVITGEVSIGSSAIIGAGAVIAPGVTIGDAATIAPGTVVRRDVPVGALASGNPMRLHDGGTPKGPAAESSPLAIAIQRGGIRSAATTGQTCDH